MADFTRLNVRLSVNTDMSPRSVAVALVSFGAKSVAVLSISAFLTRIAAGFAAYATEEMRQESIGFCNSDSET
ncbi:MAG: hypothetical protein KGM97_00845 [Alphaproteobacteria bacterium]|nr:hypothetical protein [Alphaproteobacteria bacterium]MDE2629510.1 hypothetical protein [Alphaproteobacteria bacterium]